MFVIPGRCEASNPESRDSPMCNCTSEVWSFGPSRNDRGTRMNDPVDVLIIGAGASGAAVAWSLAETKMHILCLEQGGWMNPAQYPSAGRDREARAYGDYSI